MLDYHPIGTTIFASMGVSSLLPNSASKSHEEANTKTGRKRLKLTREKGTRKGKMKEDSEEKKTEFGGEDPIKGRTETENSKKYSWSYTQNSSDNLSDLTQRVNPAAENDLREMVGLPPLKISFFSYILRPTPLPPSLDSSPLLASSSLSVSPPLPASAVAVEFDGPVSGVKTKLTLSDRDRHLVDLQTTRPKGSGGFCELFVAFHRPTGLKLAMKRPRPFPTDDMLRRFRREADMWSAFQHDHVLMFFGTMEMVRQLYLASPWMELGDMLTFVQTRSRHIEQGIFSRREKYIPNSRPLHPPYYTFTETKTIPEIAAGIKYLPFLGVVHGDIKARNVLLDSDGRVKICDFGLSKIAYKDVTSTELKGVGSIRWQSPELFHNSPKSLKSDVYAFRMTISEI